MSAPGQLIRRLRTGRGMTMRDLAREAGTSSSTLSDYETGKKIPRLDTLDRLVAATGHDLVVDAVPVPTRSTREDRRSRWLHRRIASRLRADPGEVLDKARANLATMRHAHPDGSADLWLDRWEELLDQPLDAIVGVLTGTSEEAGDLRQNTPFAGVLTPGERWAVYREFQTCEEPTSTT